MAKTLVFLEVLDGDVRAASLEAVGVARNIIGGEVYGILIGKGVSSLKDDAARYVDKLFVADSDELDYPYPVPFAKTIADVINNEGIDYFLISSTVVGREIAPLVAGLVEAISVEEVTGMENADIVIKPVVSNKAFAHIKLLKDKRVIAVKPKAFAPAQAGDSAGEVVEITPHTDKGGLTVKHIKEKEKGEIDVTEADIVVSGGRGLGGPEKFQLLRELIDVLTQVTGLKVALGASRAAVDAGWIDHSHQVGQTGKTVSPQIYFAIGISGAIQHLAGMRTSKYIIAINKDPEAPIFKVADYGIVGDLNQVVPELIEKLKQVKKS